MSIFNPDIVKESTEQAEELLYKPGIWPCPVTSKPAWIIRRSDGVQFHTIYNLYHEYHECCKYQYSREDFLKIVSEQCKDKVMYKDIYYYSYRWFFKNFIDFDKYSFIFL